MWGIIYDAIREAIFSDKVYVLKEIVNEPKTIKEIAESVDMPYPTVRKYMKWAVEKGLVIVAGTKKVGSVLAEKWLLTFVPEVVDVEEKDLILRVKIKIKMRKEFCEHICSLKCSNFERVKKGEVTPFRIITIEKRGFTGDEECKFEDFLDIS